MQESKASKGFAHSYRMLSMLNLKKGSVPVHG